MSADCLTILFSFMARKYSRYANLGAKRSRMSPYGAFERNKRFKQFGARGRWRSTGYRAFESVQFKPSRRHGFKKGRRGSSGFGSAGDTSYVSLSGLGKRQRFLGKVSKALASKSVYDTISSSRLEGNINRQAIGWIPVVFSTPLRAAFGTCTGANPNEGGKLFVSKVSTRLQMVNQTNVPVSTWIYTVMLRRDLQVVPDPGGDWSFGMQDQGSSVDAFQYPFATPFKSNRFCSQYFIRKVNKVLLAPGETHVHKFSLNVNSSLSKSRLYDLGIDATASAVEGVGGLSHFIGIVTLGGVVNDESTQTNVGYAPHSLDLAWTTSYRVSALYDDKLKYNVDYDLPSIATAKTMVEVDADPFSVIET